MTADKVETTDTRARLLRWLRQEIASGHRINASEVALLVGRHAGDLVQDSLRSPASRHLAPDLRLQAHLHGVVGIMAAASHQLSSVMGAVYWYRTARPPGLGGCTPEEAAAAGCESEVWRSLKMRAANDEPLLEQVAHD